MNPKLLLVDDEEDARHLLDYHFSAAGFDVVTACNGREALLEARRHRPAAVLLDIVLPDMDGFSVCDLLRSQPSTARTPVILLSSHSGFSVRGRGAEVGVRCCLSKSTDLASIIQCVWQAVEETRNLSGANPFARGVPSE